jgi:hypothetical protein
VVALSLPPDNQTVVLTAANEDRQKIESRCECSKRVSAIKAGNFRINMCE